MKNYLHIIYDSVTLLLIYKFRIGKRNICLFLRQGRFYNYHFREVLMRGSAPSCSYIYMSDNFLGNSRCHSYSLNMNIRVKRAVPYFAPNIIEQFVRLYENEIDGSYCYNVIA